MDTTTAIILGAFGPIALKAAPLLVAPLASLLATAAKKAPIPYEGRYTASIVAVLLLMAWLCNAGVAYFTGTWAAVDWQTVSKLLLDTLTTAGTAAGGYALLWREEVPKP